jgi:hypothetical protein
MVNEYPNRKASMTESAIVTEFDRSIADPITIPRTSPMEQPVRQCTVALYATRFSERRVSFEAWFIFFSE